MWHLSLALSWPCLPSLVDNTARAHAINNPVVMVVLVAAVDAVVTGAVGARVPRPCLTSSGAAGSAAESSGLAGTDWLCRWGTSSALSLQDSACLESFVLSASKS